MRDFFRPWRRKIGVVTLVMACGLMAGWVSSLKGLSNAFPYRIQIELVQTGIHVAVDNRAMINITTVTPTLDGTGPVVTVVAEARYRVWFAFTMPYWSIVLPLTLLSAYLLLSKPRPAKNQTERT